MARHGVGQLPINEKNLEMNNEQKEDTEPKQKVKCMHPISISFSKVHTIHLLFS